MRERASLQQAAARASREHDARVQALQAQLVAATEQVRPRAGFRHTNTSLAGMHGVFWHAAN